MSDSRAVIAKFRALAVATWFVAVAFLFVVQTNPTGSFSGGHTDAVGHVAEARILTTVGLRLWTVPVMKMFRNVTREELATMPADIRAFGVDHLHDLFVVPGFPPARPLAMTWAHNPRHYPPGMFAVAAPSAWLYDAGLVSFATANRIFIAVLISAWLLCVFVWTARWKGASPSFVRIVCFCVCAVFLAHWSVEGMYDVVAIALAAYAIERASHGTYGGAVLAFGAAVFIHARLLALAPMFAFMMFEGLRSWRTLPGASRLALLGGGVLFAMSGIFAVLIQSTLHGLAEVQLVNMYRPGSGYPIVALAYGLALVGFAVFFWRQGARLDASLVLFCGLAAASTRYLASWHWLLVLPWALGPALGRVGEPKPAFAGGSAAWAYGMPRFGLTLLLFLGSTAAHGLYRG
jgi:hypothetical protein